MSAGFFLSGALAPRSDGGGWVTARTASLIRLADRLGELAAESPAADTAIHEALGRTGPVLPYTGSAAARLLPAGCEAVVLTSGAGGRAYVAVRRLGVPSSPHHGAWGASATLATC